MSPARGTALVVVSFFGLLLALAVFALSGLLFLLPTRGGLFSTNASEHAQAGYVVLASGAVAALAIYGMKRGLRASLKEPPRTRAPVREARTDAPRD